MNDIINNPAHYTEGRKHQPIDVINDWGLNYNLGNVVKYISRAGRKDDALIDLQKADYYLRYEIKRLISTFARYTEVGNKHHPIDVINDWNLDYNLGNVVRYICQAGRENNAFNDLQKAAYYLKYEITRLLEEEKEDNKH